MLIAPIEDFTHDLVKIDVPILQAYKNVTVGSGRFIALNDLADTKMPIKMYFHFFRFLKMF